MRLMEDLATIPFNQKVIIKEVQQVTTSILGTPPPPPSNIPRAPLPQKSFKGSLSNLEMLLDVKTTLINKRKYREAVGEELEEGEFVITDEPYLNEQERKQFTEEIAKIQKQIKKIKGKDD